MGNTHIVKDSRNGGDSSLEVLLAEPTQTRKLVTSRRASCGFDNAIENRLWLGRAGIYSGNDRSAVHDSRAEQRLSLVSVVTAVDQSLVSNLLHPVSMYDFLEWLLNPTDIAPALSPQIVTLLGSPPNLAMLSATRALLISNEHTASIR